MPTPMVAFLLTKKRDVSKWEIGTPCVAASKMNEIFRRKWMTAQPWKKRSIRGSVTSGRTECVRGNAVSLSSSSAPSKDEKRRRPTISQVGRQPAGNCLPDVSFSHPLSREGKRSDNCLFALSLLRMAGSEKFMGRIPAKLRGSVLAPRRRIGLRGQRPFRW